VRRGGV